MSRQKITPCIWFDSEAEQAAELYTSLLPGSSINEIARYDRASAQAARRPEGSVLTVDFTLAGQGFVGLNGGPVFKPNPSISFHVRCTTTGQVDKLWNALSADGEPLMPLGEYPFSKYYGWCSDRYGVSWQIIYTGADADLGQRIVPALLFVGAVCGRAEEASKLYASLFDQSDVAVHGRYGPDEAPDQEGTVQYATLILAGQEFVVMDSALDHDFEFNEAVSFIVDCADQDEIDHFWTRLTADGGKESMCGWLEDKFGVSWQIVPRRLVEMITGEDSENSGRAMEALLQMQKLDIATLESAFEG